MGKSKGRGRGRGRGGGAVGRGRGATEKTNENRQPGNPVGASNVVPHESSTNRRTGDSESSSSASPVDVESKSNSGPVQSVTPKQEVSTTAAKAELTEKLETITISPTTTDIDNGAKANISQAKKATKQQGAAKGRKEVATTVTSIGSSITNEETRKKYSLPKRKGFGTVGRKIQLKANFFPIKIPDTDIHHYDVTIHDGKNIDKCPKDKSRIIIEKMVDKYKTTFINHRNGCDRRPVFDGTKNLYAESPFSFSGTKDFTLDMIEEGRERSFKISLKWVGQVHLLALQQFIAGRHGAEVPQDAIQALDLVLRHAASLTYTPIATKLFTPNGAVNIGLGLDVWHGYHQSVRPTQWKMMLNIDVCATAFYRSVDVIEFLWEITQYDCTKSQKTLSVSERKKFSSTMKGLKIEITYAGKMRRKYKVNGLTRDSAQNQTFPVEKDGKKTQVTVKNYFKDEKGVQIKYHWLPCLHVGAMDKNVYIPMEVCRIVPGQRCVKRLDEEQTAKMIRLTAKKPEERRQTTMSIIQNSKFSKDPYVKSFGVEVDSNMVDVEGRVLPTPGILYEGGGKALIPSGGAWNMKGRRLLNGAEINSWGLVVYNDRYRGALNEKQCFQFQNELMKKASEMGIKIGKPCYQRLITDHVNASNIVTEAVSKDEKIELLVVVLPGTTPFYGDLKRICETEHGYMDIENETVKKIVKERGLSTQCIQAKNAMKCNPMTLAQLCLKINAKMGGVNNAIEAPSPTAPNKFTRPARVFKEPVIFLGADVTHPGIGDKSSPSIAAVVGSMDPYPMRYAVCVRAQSHRQEMIEDLAGITIELLKQFYRAQQKKPAKIIMFRDGVSEGQFQQVLCHELSAIQKACRELENGYTPEITFLIVGKRHHAKFNPKIQQEADRSGNCPPGTTIDTTVCHPTDFDWYQFGHSGIQGTSRAAHYTLLWDDSNFTADELQGLSFMLCHLYVRCTRSVSIPAPAYYAHHVAFRARYHLQKEEGSVSSDSGKDSIDLNKLKDIVKPHPKLLSRMYFV